MKRSVGFGVGASGIGLIAIWFTIRSLIRAGEIGGAWAAIGTVLVILVGATVLVGFVMLSSRRGNKKSLRAYRALSADFPDSETYRIFGFPDFRIGVNLLRGAPPYPLGPKHMVLLIHSEKVEFWSTELSEPMLRLGSDAISVAQLMDVADSNNVTRPTVVLDVAAPDARHVSLSFLVMRVRGVTVLPESRMKAGEVVAAINRSLRL